MKVTLWRKAATATLLPALPGQWAVVPWVVYAQPLGWFTRALNFGVSRGRMKVVATIQLLAVETDSWVANVNLPLGGHGHFWPDQTTTEQANSVMAEVAALVVSEALPFFDANANLDMRLSYLNTRVEGLNEHLGSGGWQDVNVDEELTYIHILRGDLDAAQTTAHWAEQAAGVDTRDWALKANERTQRVMAAALRNHGEAIALLEEQARSTRRALKLPLTDS